MIEKIVSKQIKYSKILFILIILFMILAGYYAKDLKIETDFSKLVGSNSEFNTNKRVLESSFEINNAMVILIKEDRKSFVKNPITDMRDTRVTNYINDLKSVFPESQYVVGISNPIYSKDFRYVKLTLYLSNPNYVGSFKDVKVELEKYLSVVGKPLGTNVILTGMPTLLDRVSSLLISDNLNTVLITIIFIFLILYWYLKDITFTLITITTPLFSLIALAGLMSYLNINVSVTLAAVGVLVLGLGADYSIHIATHYRKAKRELKNHKLALIKTIDELKIPITASFITTLAGFSALIFGVSNSSQEQGIVLSLGITVIFLFTLISYPVMLTIFRNKINIKPNNFFRKIVKILSKLAIYQTHNAKTVITIVGFFTLIMLYGASQIQFSTSNSNWIPDKDDVSKNFRELNWVYGNTETLTFVIKSTKGDLRNVQTAKDLNILKSMLLGIPYVESISSPYESLNYSKSEIYNQITNTNLRSKFNYDYTITTMTLKSQNFRDDTAGHSIVLQEVRDIIKMYPVHNAKIGLYGDIIRFDELGRTLQADAGFTTIISLVLVFLVATLIYASLTVGIIALLPIVIAVLWAIGLMGFFGVPFTTLSTSIIALVIGVGIDFSIHLVDSVKRFVKRMDLESAIKETLETSGAAILLSSFTTFIGFMALLFAKLLGTQRLGLSLAFSIVAVFFVTITLVPAILSIVYKDKKRKTNKINI